MKNAADQIAFMHAGVCNATTYKRTVISRNSLLHSYTHYSAREKSLEMLRCWKSGAKEETCILDIQLELYVQNT